MDFERKSERNQQIHDHLRAERKQRSRVGLRMPAPRFDPGVVIPSVPEGMELHKFYGEPVLLPAREEGELLVGRTPYTHRQMDRLTELVDQRNRELIYRQGVTEYLRSIRFGYHV